MSEIAFDLFSQAETSSPSLLDRDPIEEGLNAFPGLPRLGEPWGYIVDDHAVAYHPDPNDARLFRRTDREEDPKRSGVVIRLAPDTQYYAWREHYVLLSERVHEDGVLRLSASFSLGRDEAGREVRASTTIAPRLGMDWADLARPNAEIWVDGPHWPVFALKMRKLQTWYRGERRNHSAGYPLLSAYDRWAIQTAERRKQGEDVFDRRAADTGERLLQQYSSELPPLPGR